MTKKEYFLLCQNHDWHFEFSDDFRVWSNGRTTLIALENLRANGPSFREIFDAWHTWAFSGYPLGSGERPDIHMYCKEE